MEHHQIMPDVIDKIPDMVLSVSFTTEKVNLGNELTPTQVKDIPTIIWENKPDKLYTLCLTDPDSPSRTNPIFKEFQHWLVVNIPGNEVSKGETLTQLVTSAPGQDSGLHRYVFLVYEQPGRLQCDEPVLVNTGFPERRRQFSIKNFAKKYSLGEPIAANFYLAQWDEYVPTVRKQLGLP